MPNADCLLPIPRRKVEAMELRKDPITRSWVICGDEPDDSPSPDYFCPFCPESGQPLQVIASSPTVNGSPWSARAVVHPHPLYGIDGEPSRTGNGLYDKMRPVGAHEVIVDNAHPDRHLWNADDREIEEYLALCAQRIQDLKGDIRFKYVSIFKNFGVHSGQEFDHPTSEVVATTFVPRRVLYELLGRNIHVIDTSWLDINEVPFSTTHYAVRGEFALIVKWGVSLGDDECFLAVGGEVINALAYAAILDFAIGRFQETKIVDAGKRRQRCNQADIGAFGCLPLGRASCR